jgi:hypothetical protein
MIQFRVSEVNIDKFSVFLFEHLPRAVDDTVTQKSTKHTSLSVILMAYLLRKEEPLWKGFSTQAVQSKRFIG